MSPAQVGTHRPRRWALLFSVSAFLALGLSEAFDLEKFCESSCLYGRGGNLCRCSAIHFAGKRGQIGGLFPSVLKDVAAVGKLEREEDEGERADDEDEEGEQLPADLVDVLAGSSRGFSGLSFPSQAASLTAQLSPLSHSAASTSSADRKSQKPANSVSLPFASGGTVDFRSGDKDDDEGEVMLEGFFGVQRRQKASVNRLVNFLKAADDRRLTDHNGVARKRQSSLP